MKKQINALKKCSVNQLKRVVKDLYYKTDDDSLEVYESAMELLGKRIGNNTAEMDRFLYSMGAWI